MKYLTKYLIIEIVQVLLIIVICYKLKHFLSEKLIAKYFELFFAFRVLLKNSRDDGSFS